MILSHPTRFSGIVSARPFCTFCDEPRRDHALKQSARPCVFQGRPVRGAAVFRSSVMMHVFEISFHNMEPPEWAEEKIRARAAKLDKIYARLTSCRVHVDQRARNSTGTIPPVVRIELGIPGRSDLVVSHEPDHLQHKYQTPDLHNAINEAFRIAEDQLVELKRRREGRTREPQHDVENQFLGEVAEISPDEDFGFLLTKEGGLLYFHRNSMLAGDFDSLARGDQVYYVEDMGDTGPIATKVRIKSAP
jgi:ribosome-associated translation inhibitor RaiA/cold shock CspA family protein